MRTHKFYCKACGEEFNEPLLSPLMPGKHARCTFCYSSNIKKYQPPLVQMSLEGTDGNGFALLGKFKVEAINQGWDKDDIKSVIEKAVDGNYDHLLNTLMENIAE